jgi:hypothetical protein
VDRSFAQKTPTGPYGSREARRLADFVAADAGLTKMGDDPKAWGLLYEKQMVAARDSLRAYVNATRATDCHFVEPLGPVLKKA